MARAATARNTTQAETELAEMRAQVSNAGVQLSDILSRAKKDGTALAEAELTELQKRLETIMGDLKIHGREALGRVEETVKEHPTGSLLAAFAAGAALTMLLRR
jgi:F0F1-type ATP synthase membrane subunit b/b'